MIFFFKIESIALIGASPNPEKLSCTILKSLLKMGLQGRLYPVNPDHQEVRGFKCYPTLDKIKDKIDIAIFAVPASTVLEIFNGPMENIKRAIIVSSDFREIGSEGREMKARLKEIIEKKGIRVIGPNCLGIYDTASKVDTFFISSDKIQRPARAGVSVLTQWILRCHDYGRNGEMKGQEFQE